jgi:CpeT protein
MKNVLLVIIAVMSVTGIAAQSQKIKSKDVKKLAQRMIGEFSSEEQSKTDTSFFNIMLRMKRILSSRKDGYWLYVEQSVATAQNKPYRQRVYHVYKENDTTVASKVYEMKNPLQYTKGWEDESKLATLVTDSLIDRQGCSIYLRKNKQGNFVGSTPGKDCLSSLRGATYATSEVTIYNDKLISWDRGWSKEDKQLWGAVKGGYIFKKIRML